MTCAAGSSAKRASTSSPSRPTPSRVRIRSLTLPGTPDCVFCKESLSEDVVYAITKSLSENRDALVAEYNSPFSVGA